MKSDAVVNFIDEYQITGGIFPAIRRDVIDREFQDKFAKFKVKMSEKRLFRLKTMD